ncbi:MAG: DUF2905 domain-containing protein [Ginsengibacter sp.]
MNQETGKYLIFFGVVVILIGILIFFFHDSFKWIGRLPGDVNISKENFRFHFPWVTMLLASIVLTILINLIRKFI